LTGKTGVETSLKLSGVALPEPEQKGCGVAFELDVTGHFDGKPFVVTSFKKTPPRTPQAQ